MKESTEKKSIKKNFVTTDIYELQFGNKCSSNITKIKYGKSFRHDSSKNGKKIY